MIGLAILFGLLAMVSYGVSNTFSQPLAKRLGPAQFLFVRGLAIATMLAVACIPTYFHMHHWLYVAFAYVIGLFGYLAPLAFTHGLKVSRIGIVAPIASTAPLFTVLLASLVLHTPLGAVQWVAVAIIVAANAEVSINFRDFRQSNLMKVGSGVPYGLVAAVLWGLGAYLMVFPAKMIGPWQTALFLEAGVTTAAAIHLTFRHEPLRWRATLNRPLLLNALCIGIGTVAYNVGVQSFNINVVASLTNSNAVVSVLAAVLFFRETFTRREKITVAVLVLGVVLVSLN